MGFEVLQGDMRIETPKLGVRFDSCVTDSPYELNFMGRGWDNAGVSFQPETWRVVYDVLKDGGRLLAFGGTRTYHRMAVAIEDAGFTIEDCIMWIYGQGFPKHRSKLKPAYEPIVVARKGGASFLNIDACRIAATDFEPKDRVGAKKMMEDRPWQQRQEADGRPRIVEGHDLGRWPANVILDPESAAALDEMSGTLSSGKPLGRTHQDGNGRGVYGAYTGEYEHTGFGDSGGASRFFYCAKAPKSERPPGCKHPTVKPLSLVRYLCRLVTPAGGRRARPVRGFGHDRRGGASGRLRRRCYRAGCGVPALH